MLTRLFNTIFPGSDLPTVTARMASRTSDFQLITLLPYLTMDGKVDYDKPYHFPAKVVPIADAGPTDRAVWVHNKISCADDICVEAAMVPNNTEIKANGLDLSTRAALLEAARTTEAETCRFIVVSHPIINRKHKGMNAIVLENTAAASSEKALVIQCVEEPTKY